MITVPVPLSVAPGGPVELAGANGVTATYTLSENAPYVLLDAAGAQIPISRLNVNEVRNRIQVARPAPPRVEPGTEGLPQPIPQPIPQPQPPR